MNTKKKLLEEIDKKAQRIREKRVDAANNKTVEVAVFEFFKNIEESRRLHDNKKYDRNLFDGSRRALEERLKGFDNKVKIAIEFNSIDSSRWEDQQVRGVTIWWSSLYIKMNNCYPSLYIDVGQMLFI
jgi:hypothetical protein